MSRSNLDKPFYVDVGTSIVAVRCASNHDVILEYDHGRSPQSQPTIQMAKDICDRMNKEVEIHNSGDCAKLREALDEILEKIDKWRTDGTMEHWQYSQLFDIADAALAAPARNCDVGTADEQAKRMDAFCARHGERIGCSWRCDNCQLCSINRCELAWAQLPYESEVAK